ncbi:MAG: efflux RND transporter periplasmic adaptor subunit [Candidatus Moraniibacteriota bacterium]
MEKESNDFQGKRRTNKKLFLILLAIIAIISFFVWRFITQEEVVEEDKEEIPTIVKTTEIGEGDLSSSIIEKTAMLKSSNSAMVLAEFSGRIKEVRFDAGDYVKEGQVLAVFDQSSAVNSAKISYESAKKSYELTKDNLEETKDVADESLELADSAVDKAEIALKQAKKTGDKDQIEIADENYESAKDSEDQTEAQIETQINNAKLQLEQAKTQLEQAEIQFNKSFIKAPTSGYLASREVDENDYLNTGSKVGEISGEGCLKAKIYLNEKEVKRVEVGDKVEIEVSGETKEGILEAVSSIATSGNQRYEAVIRTDLNIKEYANKNATVVLNVELDSGEGYFVPIDAVNIGQQKKSVFIKKGDKAISREVELGQMLGDKVEILSGLKEGDNLVIEGNRNLRDGKLLRVENKDL